jgi:hypothetical protein
LCEAIEVYGQSNTCTLIERRFPKKDGNFVVGIKFADETMLGNCPAPGSFDNPLHPTHVTIMLLRRIGPDPHLGGAQTPALQGCPDIFELENGDFAIVGRDLTSVVARELPPGATCGPDERIIIIPRKTLVLAKPHIPENL